MILIIQPEELIEEFRESWKLGYIKNVNLDYATNAVHATFENKDVIIYKFNKFGFITNQSGTNRITAGPAGILIEFYHTK